MFFLRDNTKGKAILVENGLQKQQMQIEGKSIETFNIYDRMREHKVSQVSITVINDGNIDWSNDYKMNSGSTIQELFQAASISKPVTAAIVLSLTAGKKVGNKFIKLDLDQDVNELLTSWKIPTSNHTAYEKVTLRRLLSHTAGLSVQGFGGYAKNTPLPSNHQILNGSAVLVAQQEFNKEKIANCRDSYVFIKDTQELFIVDNNSKSKKVEIHNEIILSLNALMKDKQFINLSYKQMTDLITSGEYDL